MWQASNGKNGNSRFQRERNRAKFHLRRTLATIKTLQDSGETSQISLMINDLSEKGFGFFCNRRIEQDQPVEISITAPFQKTVKGTVIWCQEYIESHHIISGKKFGFRIGVRFKFETPADEESFKKLCEDQLPALACVTKAA